MKMKFLFIILALTFILEINAKILNGQTYCNPLNLTRPYEIEQATGGTISDPTIVLYNDNYFLFASNAGGYWYSNDLLSWKFITTENLPFKKPEPTAAVIGKWIYFFNSLNDKIYRSNDPVNGKWEEYSSSIMLSIISDYTVFADTDGRVYCYYGCSNHDGVMMREMDPNNLLNPIGIPVICQKINSLKNNRTKPKANSDKTNFNVQGSWMNKYNGKYYYQCAEQNGNLYGVSDVVYVSDSPLGPFKYATSNPFSYRPDGFVCGAGNGSTFADKYGNWWHIADLIAPSNHRSKSRLGLFPAGFDKDGILFTKTDFGDFPIIMPNHKITDIDKLDPEWALLSDHIIAQASSSLASNSTAYAFDEDIGTYWSAQTGNKGEWLSFDLGSVCTINAYQLNFEEINTQKKGSEGVLADQYLVQYSLDNKNWKTLSDKTTATEFQHNPYEEIKIPVQAQYLKITNYHVPQGSFAISEFRIFGSGTNCKPKKIDSFRAIRDYRDPQIIKMSWKKPANATGYNIRYGIAKDKLYHAYQVFNKTRLTVTCPDKNKAYWFEIDAFNENGLALGKLQLAK